MNNEIDFSKQYEYDVEMYHDDYGILGPGTLYFGGGKFAYVSLEVFGGFVRPDGETILKARAKSGEKFTLINCTYQDYIIHSDLIIGGDIGSGTNDIIIRYADISDWFMFDQDVKGIIGESLTWTNPVPQMNVSIENEDESFSLRSDISSKISKRGEDRTIHQHINFIFSRINGEFSFSDLKNKPHELSSLLSILIAYPISISNMWVTSSSGYQVPAYFPAFKRVERDFDENVFWRNALVSRPTLDARWQTIFERYYNSIYRKVHWIRLAGMQRHEGFWEYKVLGYVSLLDGYASELTKANKIKPTNTKKEKIDSIFEALSTFKNPLSKEQLNEIRPIMESAFPKRRNLNFTEKYNYLIETTDANIVKIINLSEDDFKLIKHARDTIAHGSAVDLIEIPYEKIHSITEKLALLLTFRALNDFGMTPDEFMENLARTHNRLRFNKKLNMVHLQRITDPASFLTVSQPVFDKISNLKSAILNACLTKDSKGELEYSEKHVAAYKAWLEQRPAKSGPTSFEDIFDVAKERVTHIGTAFLEFDGNLKELYDVYIISDA